MRDRPDVNATFDELDGEYDFIKKPELVPLKTEPPITSAEWASVCGKVMRSHSGGEVKPRKRNRKRGF